MYSEEIFKRITKARANTGLAEAMWKLGRTEKSELLLSNALININEALDLIEEVTGE